MSRYTTCLTSESLTQNMDDPKLFELMQENQDKDLAIAKLNNEVNKLNQELKSCHKDYEKKLKATKCETTSLALVNDLEQQIQTLQNTLDAERKSANKEI